MKKSRVRSRWQAVSVGQSFTEPSLTDQSQKDETDINLMVARIMKGHAVRTNQQPPQFIDVSDVPSIERAFEITRAATESFMTLPAKLRKLIDNDPRRISELTREDFASHGLITPKASPEPSVARAEPSEAPPRESSKKTSRSSAPSTPSDASE